MVRIGSFLKFWQTTLPEAAPKFTQTTRQTQSFIDSINGIKQLEREFIGKDGIPKVFTSFTQKLGDGSTRTITEVRSGSIGDSFDKVRTLSWTNRVEKIIKREKDASILGGDKITIDKDKTMNWCHGETIHLTKDYDANGVLQHKELTRSFNSGNEGFIHIEAAQDRVFAEHPLNSSITDMYAAHPNPYIRHSLRRKVTSIWSQLPELSYDNNCRFSGDSLYTQTVKLKEKAALDAARAIEEAKIAMHLEAEKVVAELKATRPRINVGQVFGKNIEKFQVKETKLADGTIERIYTEKGSDAVLIKTHDKGTLHREWITGSNMADMIFMKQVGEQEPYIVAIKGNHIQIHDRENFLKKYSKANVYLDTQYYYTPKMSFSRKSNKGELLSGKLTIDSGTDNIPFEIRTGDVYDASRCPRNMWSDIRGSLNQTTEDFDAHLHDLAKLFKG